jgi:hypothetical protein
MMEKLGLLDYHKFLLNFRHCTYLWRKVIYAHPPTHQWVAEGAVTMPHDRLSLINSMEFIISQHVTKWGLIRTLALQRENSNSSMKKVVMGSGAVRKKMTRMIS